MRVRQGRQFRCGATAAAVAIGGLALFAPVAFGQAGAGAGANGANNAAGAATAPGAGAAAGNTGAAAGAPGATAGMAGNGAPGAAGAGTPGTAGQAPGAAGQAPGAAGQAPGAATPGSDLVSAPPAAGNSATGTVGSAGTGQSPAPGAAPGGAPGTQQGGSVAVGARPSTVWDLPSATSASLRSSSDLANAQRIAEIDRKRADEAAAAGRPNVNATASATRYDQATKIAIGASPPIEVQKEHSELLSINLANTIDLTGQIRTASNQATLQSQADEYQVQQIRNARILRAQTVYYNLLRARHQVQVAQAALTDAQTQAATAVNLNTEGVGQRIDVLRANTQVATAQQNLSQAQNAAAIAQANFNDLVGQPLATPVYVKDVAGANVGVTAVGSAAVGAPTNLETLFAPPTAEIDAIDIDRSLATAYAQRPEILSAATLVRANQLGIKLAHAGLEPSLRITAAGDYFPTTSFQTPRQRTAEITAAVVFPLYDGGATRDRVAEAKLRTQNAETTLSSTRSDVALDVRQAYLNLATAASQISSANSALEQAVAARQLAQIRYEGQVGLYLEVTDAEAALVSAQNNQVNAVYNYEIARAQYLTALGTPQTQ